MPVKEADRPYLVEMRMLGRDTDGREILVGLTFDETEWYLAHLDEGLQPERLRAWKSAAEIDADRDRYLELLDRHETARL